MVVVLVGILAAVALPRLFDASADARAASNRALYGAISSGVTIAHNVALSKGLGSVASDTTSVVLEGNTTPTALAFGYPSAAGVASAISSSYGAPVLAGATATWTISAAAGCTVTYAEATLAGVAPVLTQNLSGC